MKQPVSLLVIGIFCLYACILLFQAASQPIQPWDELTNLRVIAESSYRITPFLTFQNQPFFEKPPLWYITASLVTHITSRGVFPIRIISVLSGLITAFFLYRLGCVWYGKTGGLITLLTFVTIGQLNLINTGGFFSSHTLTSADSDSVFITFITISYFFFSEGIRKVSQPIVLLGGSAVGLALVTKSPLAVIPLLSFLYYAIHANLFTRRELIATAIISFLPYLLWITVMYAKYNNNFLINHFGYHVFTRMITAIEGHQNSWWYYLKVITHPEVFLLWPLSLIGIILMIKNSRKSWIEYSLLTIIILYFLAIFIAETRLAWYLLPLYPFLALAAGYPVSNLPQRKTTRSI